MPARAGRQLNQKRLAFGFGGESGAQTMPIRMNICYAGCLLVALHLATLPGRAQEPANTNSNGRVKAILHYLQGLERRSDKRLLSGQFTGYGGRANLDLMNRIHDQTDHWPAIAGVDYSDFVRKLNWNAPNKAAIDYWTHGGLVTISAHLYDPANTGSNANNGGLRDKFVDLDTLLDPASETHSRWMDELDQMAAGLQQLKDAGVVVMWRPFHEMNGAWFWWGGKEPEKFIKLWRHMFDYFTRTKGLDNLIWVYGPNCGETAADYYPGDHYADVVGLDAYTDIVDAEHIPGYEAVSRLGKPFGFTEFGPHGASNPPGDFDYRLFLRGIQKHFPRAVLFMSWNSKWSLARNANVREFLEDPWIVNREDLPLEISGGR